MILVTGGAFQGKTRFVTEVLKVTENQIVDGGECEIETVKSAVCVKNYQLLLKRLIENNMDCIEFTKSLNKDIIIIMDEIGCGVIPIEKSERLWREAVGRTGSYIAFEAETVIRISCGLHQVIKGEIL